MAFAFFRVSDSKIASVERKAGDLPPCIISLAEEKIALLFENSLRMMKGSRPPEYQASGASFFCSQFLRKRLSAASAFRPPAGGCHRPRSYTPAIHSLVYCPSASGLCASGSANRTSPAGLEAPMIQSGSGHGRKLHI